MTQEDDHSFAVENKHTARQAQDPMRALPVNHVE